MKSVESVFLPGEPQQEEVPPLPLAALPDVVQDGVEIHPTHFP